jgi:hypothetical protein
MDFRVKFNADGQPDVSALAEALTSMLGETPDEEAHPTPAASAARARAKSDLRIIN